MVNIVAVLVDGAFFIKRYQKLITDSSTHTPKQVAKAFEKMCWDHINKKDNDKMYRIFYYDCPPLNKSVIHPLTDERINFSQSPTTIFRKEFFKELKKKRKVALRMGILKSRNDWLINPEKTKDLIKGKIQIQDLSKKDIVYNVKQKTVDMKIGIDIASLVLKKHINKIILVAGDGDFIPAAKLARREGVDFVLDHMGMPHIDDSLFEHIDGIKTTLRPYKRNKRT